MIDFKCESCGHVFSVDSSDCDYDRHCNAGDEYCSCYGMTFYTICPECNKDCDTYIG